MSASATARLALALLVLALVAPPTAAAHGRAPQHIIVRERAPGVYAVETRAPEGALPARLRWPEGCSEDREGTTTLRCPGGLRGAPLALADPARAPEVLVTFVPTPPPGEPGTSPRPPPHAADAPGAWRITLSPDRPAARLDPPRHAAVGAAVDLPGAVRMGVEHILSGWDHVLFVLLLVLAAGGLRPLLLAVTAFTVGHSLTLAAGALGAIPRAATVEVLIALSVALVARDLALRHGPGHRGRPSRPVAPHMAAGAFGMLHGLGFAGALAPLALAPGDLVGTLLGFNLGVELGQLAIVVPAALLAGGLARLPAPARATSALTFATAAGAFAAAAALSRARLLLP